MAVLVGEHRRPLQAAGPDDAAGVSRAAGAFAPLHQPQRAHRWQLAQHPLDLRVGRPLEAHRDVLLGCAVFRGFWAPEDVWVRRTLLHRHIPRGLHPEPPRPALRRVERAFRVVLPREPPLAVGDRRPPVHLAADDRHPRARNARCAEGAPVAAPFRGMRLEHRALTGRPHPPASARTSEAPGAPARASGAPSTPGWWPWAERSASPPGCRAPAEHGPDRRPGLDVPALAARAPAADPGRSLPGDRRRSGSCAAASPAASSASTRTAPATATERREPSFRIVQSFPPACRTDPRLISGTAPRTAKPDPPHAASRPNRRPHSITTCRSGARTQRSPRRRRHRPSTESGTPSTPGAARLMTAESAQASEGRSCVESSIPGRARGRSDRVTAGVGSRSRYPDLAVERLVVMSDSVTASPHAPSRHAPAAQWFRLTNPLRMLQTRARSSRPPYGGV